MKLFPMEGVLVIVLATWFVSTTHAQTVAPPCSPLSYGAKADGRTKDTKAIQAAIDDCAKRGGGIVELSAGTYLSAPIELKSNITLQLDKGATLLGTPDHEDYARITEFRVPGRQPLVGATNATNIKISGEGTIDGSGQTWWDLARSIKGAGIMGSDQPRPRLVVFDHCRSVIVEGVTLQNGAFWQLNFYYSDDITVQNIKVLAPDKSLNSDGIDPFSSSNVRIDHVYVSVGDDDIAIKSGVANSPGPDAPCRNIKITNSTFALGRGLSIGSEVVGGVQNLTVENVHFEGTYNGIRVKANRDRGGDVSNLVFRDISMKDVKFPIVITEIYNSPGDISSSLSPNLVAARKVEPAQPITKFTPRFHDITIENLTVTGATWAGEIGGLPEMPVQNMVLKNVSISSKNGLMVKDSNVSGENVVIRVLEGKDILSFPGANISIH